MTGEINIRTVWEKKFMRDASKKGLKKEKIREMWEKSLQKEVADLMVEDGRLRVAGIRKKGRKIYNLIDTGRSRLRGRKPPKLSKASNAQWIVP
jgi:hypothetical protein